VALLHVREKGTKVQTKLLLVNQLKLCSLFSARDVEDFTQGNLNFHEILKLHNLFVSFNKFSRKFPGPKNG